MGLGKFREVIFPSRFSTKLPLKPFFVLVPNVLDWGFITTSDQDESATGGIKDVIAHRPVAKIVPVP